MSERLFQTVSGNQETIPDSDILTQMVTQGTITSYYGQDSGTDDCTYQNAATCPDCSGSMIRQGGCCFCPECGLESCFG